MPSVARETPAVPREMPRHSPCCHSCLCAGLSAQRSPASHEHLQGASVTPSAGPSPLCLGSRPQTARLVGIRDEPLGSLAQLCQRRALWGGCPARFLGPPFKGKTNPQHWCGEGKCCGQRLGELCSTEEPNPTAARAGEIPGASCTPRMDYPSLAGLKLLKPTGSGRVNLPLVR